MRMMVAKNGLMMVVESTNGEVLDVIALDSGEVFNTIYREYFGWSVDVDNVKIPTESNIEQFHMRTNKLYAYVVRTDNIVEFLNNRAESAKKGA